jgi:DNA modification methylase
MCGDSTDAGSVTLLMGGGLADFLFTSPPYNVGVAYGEHDDATAIWDDYGAFLSAVVRSWLPSLADGRVVGWNILSSPKTFPHRQMALLEEAGCTYLRTMVWQKVGVPVPLWHNTRSNPVARNFHPNPTHEWVLLFSKGPLVKGGPVDPDELLENDVFRVLQSDATRGLPDDPTAGYTGAQSNLSTRGRKVHPAAYPVRLPAMFASCLCDVGAVMADPFLGSGTTLIAAEQLGRICYGMEIDPAYCDVIVRRWENFTGKKATLAS